MRLPPELEWQKQAACADMDTEVFFTEAHYKEAIPICKTCPVKTDCLQYAKTEQINHGIWGGLTPPQRQPNGRRTRQATGVIEHGTYQGYRMHHRHGILPACEPCRLANNQYAADTALRRKLKKEGTT